MCIDHGFMGGVDLRSRLEEERLTIMMFLYSDTFEENPWIKDVTIMASNELEGYIDSGMLQVAESNGVEVYLEYCDIYLD